MIETKTSQYFKERIASLEKQYGQFISLKEQYTGVLSDAYASLAANVLSTISELKYLYEIYLDEYDTVDND
jgi:hypothetical protein